MINSHLSTEPSPTWSVWLCASLIAAAMLSASCSDSNDNRTVGQKLDSAITTTEQSVVEAKQAAKVAASDVKVALKDVADNAKIASAQMSSDASSAINNVTTDLSTRAEDTVITTSIAAGLAKDPDLSAIKIEVETKGGNVALYGAAANAQAKERATLIATSVKGVRAVDNKLTVKN